MNVRALLVVALSCTLAGCASWDKLPPTTYAGTVMNAPLNQPEPGAMIKAQRPTYRPGPLDFTGLLIPHEIEYETIGTTRTDRHGHFSLVTTRGYATTLFFTSVDQRLTAYITDDLEHSTGRLDIALKPEVTQVEYSVPVPQHDVDAYRIACNKIMFHYASTHYGKTLSIDAYYRRAVLTKDEYDLFTRLGPKILGPSPGMQVYWTRMTLRIASLDKPVDFIEQGSNYTPEDLLRLKSPTPQPRSAR
jgi:hypothetical protein